MLPSLTSMVIPALRPILTRPAHGHLLHPSLPTQLILVDLFRLDGGVSPHLLRGGKLAPLMNTCLASQVKYYEERFNAGEMKPVLGQMQKAVTKAFGKDVNAHNILLTWSRLIYDDDRVKNIDSVDAHAHSAAKLTQMCQIMTALGKSMGQLAAANLALQVKVDALQHTVGRLVAALPVAAMQPVDAALASDVAGTPAGGVAGTPTGGVAGTPGAVGAATELFDCDSGSLLGAAAGAPVSSTNPPTSLEKLSAADLFLWMASHDGAIQTVYPFQPPRETPAYT